MGPSRPRSTRSLRLLLPKREPIKRTRMHPLLPSRPQMPLRATPPRAMSMPSLSPIPPMSRGASRRLRTNPRKSSRPPSPASLSRLMTPRRQTTRPPRHPSLPKRRSPWCTFPRQAWRRARPSRSRSCLPMRRARSRPLSSPFPHLTVKLRLRFPPSTGRPCSSTLTRRCSARAPRL